MGFEVPADEDSKCGRTTYDNGHRCLKNSPQEHPLRLWHGSLASCINAELDDTECGEDDADEATSEQNEDTGLLTPRHLQIPGQVEG